MSKLKYLIQRIKGMNYQQFFTTINQLHKKTKKNKVYLFFDIIYCGFKYQAGYMDYQLFEMYNLNAQERKTIITRGINNEFIKKLNDSVAMQTFHNKILFNKKFNKYLKREWLELNDTNFEEFKAFATKHPSFIAKPVDQFCGKGVEKYSVNSQNISQIYQKLLQNKQYLIEEVAIQCSAISKLHPNSINTLRVVTINQEVVAAYIRIGNNNNIVDNFNHEGLAAPINIATGIVDYPAIDKKHNLYEKHPLTEEPILWFQIPKWEKIKEFCIKASKEEPKVGYVGWDVCLTDKGPCLIEGNEFPGHDIYQLPPHRTNNQGLLPIFLAAIEKEKK